MSNSNSSQSIAEAVKLLVSHLSSRRSKDVLEKRFGLRGRPKTLEAIGGEYKITRERVRQIEDDAIRRLQEPRALAEIEPALKLIKDELEKYGGVVAESYFLPRLCENRVSSQAVFLMEVGRNFYQFPETESFYKRWASGKEAASRAEKVMAGVTAGLQKTGSVVKKNELLRLAEAEAKNVSSDPVSENALDAILGTSRVIHQNPYGEYGLVSWSQIKPRGVKDKACLVLQKAGRPLHFKEVAQAISKAGWSSKKAHPQTVHNELIKDPRFVLVGRGLYALKEWGYEPGVVRDVLTSVFKKCGRPLGKEEAVKLVLEKRMVKPQTVLLNLQNKSLFKRLSDGKYLLA